MKSDLRIQKLIGSLLILGVIFVMVPYTTLSLEFNYPKILRQPVGEILTKFHQGGLGLILTWWLFAISGLIILIAYNLLGIRLKQKIWYADFIVHIGNISAMLQIIGLMRWVFIVPILANLYHSSDDVNSKNQLELVFITIHQYGGVILGEHLGQIFTIFWMFLISNALYISGVITNKSKYFAIASGLIYLLAQLELIKTIYPDFITIKFAGLIGSTMWLIWLLWLGIDLLKNKNELFEIDI